MKNVLCLCLMFFCWLASTAIQAAEILTPKGGVEGCVLRDGRLLHVCEDDEGDTWLMLDNQKLAMGHTPRPSPDGNFVAFCVGYGRTSVKLLRTEDWTVISPVEKITPERGAFWWVDGCLLVWRKGAKTLAWSPEHPDEKQSFEQVPTDTLAVSQDGKKVVVKRKTGLEVRTMDGETLATIDMPPTATTETYRMNSPVFSPDGSKVAYVQEGIRPIADIMLLDLKTGETKAVTSDGKDHKSPMFSPAGNALLFSGLNGEATVLFREPLKKDDGREDDECEPQESVPLQ